MTKVLSSFVFSLHLSAFNFLKVASKIGFWPTLRPRFSESLQVWSFRASSLSRSSFFSTSMVASFSWLVSHQDLKSKVNIFQRKFYNDAAARASSLESYNEVTLNLSKYVHGPHLHFRDIYLILINRFITHKITQILLFKKAQYHCTYPISSPLSSLRMDENSFRISPLRVTLSQSFFTSHASTYMCMHVQCEIIFLLL